MNVGLQLQVWINPFRCSKSSMLFFSGKGRQYQHVACSCRIVPRGLSLMSLPKDTTGHPFVMVRAHCDGHTLTAHSEGYDLVKIPDYAKD